MRLGIFSLFMMLAFSFSLQGQDDLKKMKEKAHELNQKKKAIEIRKDILEREVR